MAKVTDTQFVEEALRNRLKLDDPQFELESVGGRISGSVISASFRGTGDYERQKMIWDALEGAIGGARAVREVGMLLAYTPEEWNVDLEG